MNVDQLTKFKLLACTTASLLLAAALSALPATAEPWDEAPMYPAAKAVDYDKREALDAERGDDVAQYLHAVSYLRYPESQSDWPQVYKWLTLCADNTKDAKLAQLALRLRDSIDDRMTPGQIAEAKRLATDWKPKTP
jgi:hypothetical protein